jgi:ABC-2 type transport system permease protein
MSGTLHAEWTKLRTVPSTVWLLTGIVAATVAAGTMQVNWLDAAGCLPVAGCVADTTKASLSGLAAGQAVVAVLALLAMTNEYSTRMICTTLMTDARRVRVLLCKAGVVTAAVLAAGALGVAASMLAGRVILSGNGFTAANGYSPLSLADQPTLRAAAGSVLYLGLIALLSIGIGTIVRDTAGAVTTVMAVLYLAPLATALTSDPQWRERLNRFAPTNAGQAIQATVELDQLPIGPWAGLGVLAGWAGAATVLGALLFKLRDA